MYTCDDLIDLAVQIEKNGEKRLRSAEKQISNRKLLPLLRSLADDELHHAEWFSHQRSVSQETLDEDDIEAIGRQLLQDTLGDQSFSLADVDFSKIDRSKDLLLSMIEFANDTVLFYEMIRTVISDKETLKCLDKIIAAEKRNAGELKAILNKV